MFFWIQLSPQVDWYSYYDSWSRDDQYILTSGQDCKSVLWDLKDGSRMRTVRFDAPVYIAELHPFNQYSLSYNGIDFSIYAANILFFF